MTEFPSHEEQRAAIFKTFGEAPRQIDRDFGIKPDVRILAFARPFASATVKIDGEDFDVCIYRDASGTARTGDTFNRRFDTGE